MKKIVLCAIVALSLLPLAAGGKKDSGKEVNLNAPVRLILWTHEDPARAKLEKSLIEKFTAQNPNVSVDYQTYPSGKMRELLTVAFSANQGPDVFNQGQSVIRPFVVGGYVSALDPAWIGEKNLKDVLGRYLPNALEPAQFENKLYGLPLEYTNLCIYLNKKSFREIGLDPEKDYPKTWEDIMTLSEKLVIRNGDILTRRGFDFRYPSYNLMVPMIEQLGGKLISDDGKKGVVGDEAWLKFFEYMQMWGPKGKNLGGPTYVAARTAFDMDNNQIVMSESGLYQQARMKASNPAFFNSGEWMVIPYPHWKNAKMKATGSVSSQYYLVNGSVALEKQIWGWRLINFMLSHSEDYLAQVNLVQPATTLFESQTFKNIPYSKVFQNDLKTARIAYYSENSGIIFDKLQNAVEAVMLQGQDPAAVLITFRKAVQEVIDQQ